MYRVRLQYDVPGWAYYRRCAALQKHAPADHVVVFDGEQHSLPAQADFFLPDGS